MRIAIVQFSDIHFRKADNAICGRVAPLVAAIRSSDPTCDEYVFVLSGDLANSAELEEYAIAKKFFVELSDLMATHRPGCRVRYFSIPGNHDCYLPESEIGLRDTLVQGVRNSLQSAAPDLSILDNLLKRQRFYFDFAKDYGWDTSEVIDRICTRQTVVLGGEKIQINLYNTALLSTRSEKQGELSMPMRVVKSKTSPSEDCALSISVFHHPYTWLEAGIGLEFRTHIERASDIVLTGHQHFDHAFDKQTSTGENVLYSEGEVLQQHEQPGQSGFRVILVDLAEKSRCLLSYSWKDTCYMPVTEAKWQPYTRSLLLNRSLSAVGDFLAELSDSGIGLTHRTKGSVPLETLFVYPDVAVRPLTSPEKQRDVTGANLLTYLNGATKVIIEGGPLSGKTSLAKTIVKDWLRNRLFYPLLLKGSDIKRADQAFLDRLFNNEAARAYGTNNPETYKQLRHAAKVLIVDDWNQSPLTLADKDAFLTRAEAYFGKVVLLVDSFQYIRYVLSKLSGSSDPILKYDHVTIKEMSYVSRGQIIDRWLHLDGLTEDSAAFNRKVEDTERLVKNVIGKNTLPSLPFIVLVILQASQQQQYTSILPENGSFGYLYEVLITAVLSSTREGGRQAQLDKKYTFLSLLAFKMFTSSVDMLREAAVEDLLDRYGEDYKIKVDKSALLGDLEHARVIVRIDGHYSFVYPHYFHYFLTRYFKNNFTGAQGSELKARLKKIASGLNVGANRIFLMFFIYLTHDEQLTDELVGLGGEILAGFSPSELTQEVEFYNSKNTGVEQKIPERVDLAESRQSRRKAADLMEEADPEQGKLRLEFPVSDGAYSEAMSLSDKLDYASGCLEILGQILRNFTGSLPGHRKIAILKTTYLLGLRTLRALLWCVGDVTVGMREELAKNDSGKAADLQVAKSAEKLLAVVAQAIGASVFHTISLNVGSPEIDENAYTETLELIGRSNATELIDLAIKLDHFEAYPFEEIKRLRRRFADNRYATNVLRDLVVANVHVFDIGRQNRQRVLGLFDETQQGDALLSRKTKRF